jgi:hypothetical protein
MTFNLCAINLRHRKVTNLVHLTVNWFLHSALLEYDHNEYLSIFIREF